MSDASTESSTALVILNAGIELLDWTRAELRVVLPIFERHDAIGRADRHLHADALVLTGVPEPLETPRRDVYAIGDDFMIMPTSDLPRAYPGPRTPKSYVAELEVLDDASLWDGVIYAASELRQELQTAAPAGTPPLVGIRAAVRRYEESP
jgi:hypothetical protein